MKFKNFIISFYANFFILVNSRIVRIWFFIYLLSALIFLFGISVEKFESGQILYFFGKESPDFNASVLFIYYYLQYFLIIVFFPISTSKFIYSLIDKKIINYSLSSSITRTQLIIGNQLSFFVLYFFIILFVNSILYFGIYFFSAKSFLSIGEISIITFFLVISAHSFFMFLVIITKSLNIGSFLFLLYTLFLSNLIVKRVNINTWWGILIDESLNLVGYLLPPNVLIQNSFPSIVYIPQSNIPLIVLISFMCVVFYTSISAWFYNRLDF